MDDSSSGCRSGMFAMASLSNMGEGRVSYDKEGMEAHLYEPVSDGKHWPLGLYMRLSIRKE